MPKQLLRICPSDRICRVQNLLTSSVELIWPIKELYFRQILSKDFLNRFYQDVKIGPPGDAQKVEVRSNMDFYLELHVFGAVPVRKKMKFLTYKGGIHCISQVFPWHFYFMRGHSLVELTEHDDNAADIILHSMWSYTYMHCCIHSA